MNTEGNKEFIRRYLDAISGKPKPESVLRLFIAEQPLIEHIMVAEYCISAVSSGCRRDHS